MKGKEIPAERGQNRIIYEYCLLRYVPDLERGEFVNVGMLMMCKRYKWLRGEVFICEEKIGRLSGRKNLPLLKQQLSIFTRSDIPASDLPTEEKYRWMAAKKSAIIQTSPSHPGILIPSDGKTVQSQLEHKFSELFNRLVK